LAAGFLIRPGPLPLSIFVKAKFISQVTLRRMLDHPLLSKEEEASLAMRIKTGDEKARHELVRHNLRLAWAFAVRGEAGRSVRTEELFGEAILALYKTSARFDAARGTFAQFCEFRLKRAWRRHARFEGYPSAVSQGSPDRAEQNSPGDRLGRSASKKVRCNRRPYSIHDESAISAATIPDESVASPDAAALSADQRDLVRRALATLDPRTRLVIERRYGFDSSGIDDTTAVNRLRPLRAVGVLLGLSGERIRQLEHEGLAELKRSLNGRIVGIHGWSE
jgi:RNA polymerase sigma factor (sigma-70 family)